MSIRSVVMSTFAGAVLFATSAIAQSTHNHHNAAFKAACGDDIEKLCSGESKGRAVFACLKTHDADLSDSCKAFRAEHHKPQADDAAK